LGRGDESPTDTEGPRYARTLGWSTGRIPKAGHQSGAIPRVGRRPSGQPWAGIRNPFGVRMHVYTEGVVYASPVLAGGLRREAVCPGVGVQRRES